MEQVGSVLAELTRLGLEGIGYELVTDIKAWGRKVHETTAVDAAAEYIKEHPTFHIGELVAHLAGRSRGAVDAAVRSMVAKKSLTKLGNGNYQRADVKAIAPPTKEAEKTRRGQTKPYDISNKDLIWRHIKNRTRFKIADLVVLFRANKRLPKSISPQLSFMIGDNLIKSAGRGEYIVLKNKTAKVITKKKFVAKRAAGKQKPPTESPKLNGSASSEIATNG